MKTRGIIGKRIVAIRQERFFNCNTGRFEWDVCSIKLENGTALILDTTETGSYYAHDLIVAKPKRTQ